MPRVQAPRAGEGLLFRTVAGSVQVTGWDPSTPTLEPRAFRSTGVPSIRRNVVTQGCREGWTIQDPSQSLLWLVPAWALTGTKVMAKAGKEPCVGKCPDPRHQEKGWFIGQRCPT